MWNHEIYKDGTTFCPSATWSMKYRLWPKLIHEDLCLLDSCRCTDATLTLLLCGQGSQSALTKPACPCLFLPP